MLYQDTKVSWTKGDVVYNSEVRYGALAGVTLAASMAPYDA
jgi:hypothetical protein